MKSTLLVLLICLVSACSPSLTPSTYLLSKNQDDQIRESLFNSKESTINEEDIGRLLDGHIELPDTARIAIYNFGNTTLNKYYTGYRYNEEFLKLRQSNIEALTSTIGASTRVEKVVLMPSIMVSQDPTLTNLRESAVRLQADVLIIFSITSDIYYKYKAFKKDQAKAFATVETVFLDVRTGVVPYSSIITEEQLIQKKEEDLDIRETQKRAESEAVLKALKESGAGLVEFLSNE